MAEIKMYKKMRGVWMDGRRGLVPFESEWAANHALVKPTTTFSFLG